MNFAGDMPYNQTIPSLFLQFMQVPHKALLQLSNRRLSKTDRAKLVTLDLFLWGTPFATLANMMGEDVLPEDRDLREFVLWGFESVLINNYLSMITGTDTRIDFSSLAPYQSIGEWRELMLGMYEGGPAGALANSPAGTFYPKVWEVGRKAGMFMGVVDNPIETMNKTIDEAICNHVNQLFATYIKGVPKDEFSKVLPADVQQDMYNTALTFNNILSEHSDLIEVLFLTENLPASTAYIYDMVRRCVVGSDTDATMFVVDGPVEWMFGHTDITEETMSFASTIMFLSATFWMMRMPAQHAYKIGEDGDLIPIPNKLYDDGDMNNLWLGGTPDD
jgi:hypothetical protein